MIRGYNNTSSDPSSNSTTSAMGRSENLEGKAKSLSGCATNRFAPWLGGQRPDPDNTAREPLGREYLFVNRSERKRVNEDEYNRSKSRASRTGLYCKTGVAK